MKNKILPLSLVTLVILLGAFLISATVSFPGPFSFGPDNDSDKEISKSTHLTEIRANQHTGVVDAADVLKAHRQSLENTTKGTAEDFEWKLIGPDNAGGYTKAILFDNTDANGQTIYAGAFSGGLYKSTNTGLTWTKINGIENALNVSSIAQAPDGPIYVSTGGWFIGSGIYKSVDGENFILLESTDPVLGGIEAFGFTNELAINQENGVIFASTDLGVWYSSDEGTSWNLARSGETELLVGFSTDINIGSNGITAASVEGLCYISATGHPNQFELHSGDTFNLPSEGVGNLELAIAPSNPDVLYATVLENDDDLMNIYRSDNKGVNWRIIAPGGSSTLEMQFLPRNNVLVVFPDNEDRILVGGADMWEGTQIEPTGYFQWLQQSTGGTFIQDPAYIHTWHYSYTFRPGSSTEIFIGHDGGISRGTITSTAYEFEELNKTYTTSTVFNVGISGFPEIILGGFDMNGVMLLNGHGNPAQAGYGVQIWVNGNTGLLAPAYGGNGGESFISIIDPYVAIYSAEGGDFRRSEDLGENYSTTFFSSGINFPDDYMAPALLWENFENENSRDTVGFSARDTIPVGTELWLPSANRSYPFNVTAETTYYPGDTMIFQDPISTKMFVGTDNAVWMTLEILHFGEEPEWFQISNSADAGLDGLVTAMAMSADANFVYVGTEEGSVYRIANISLAYNYERADVRSPYCIISTSEILTVEDNDQRVTSIAVDPQDPNKLVVTLGNYGNDSYVLKCTNGLSTSPSFTSAQGNLPQSPVFSSIIEMNNSNMCIVGTEMGVYETKNLNDANPVWNTSYEVMGKVPVMDLKQQLIAQPTIYLWFYDGVDTTWVTYYGTFNYGNIYAATYGRGLFYSNKYQKPVGIITQDVPEQLSSIKVYPNPVKSMATIEYTLHKRSPITISVVDLNGRMVAREQLTQAKGTHNYKLDCGSLPPGMYVVSIQTGNSVQTSKFIVTH